MPAGPGSVSVVDAERPALAVWYHADITRQRLGGRLVGPLLRRCLGEADGICVSTAALARTSPLLQPWRDKVRVIPFGIDPEPFAVVGPAAAGPFLFVGRLVRYKGVLTVVEAVGSLPGAELEIVGTARWRERWRADRRWWLGGADPAAGGSR